MNVWLNQVLNKFHFNVLGRSRKRQFFTKLFYCININTFKLLAFFSLGVGFDHCFNRSGLPEAGIGGFV